MGENLSDARYADIQLPPQLHGPLQPPGISNGMTNGEEEPYTIKCICGFLDDDGHTVLCEQCNTWQHIECYYWPALVVPEVHQCADCLPRVLDASEASQRQRRHRVPLNLTDDRRLKRPVTKPHKKTRTKEHNNAGVLQSGWPAVEPSTIDGRNGSPRDQPPPAKRPKTNHRSSTSLSLQTLHRPVGQRDVNGLHDPTTTRLPRIALAECPPNYLSEHFIRLHREDDEFTIAQANTHLNIGVANLLAKWLDDVDAFAEATQGRTQNQIFKFLPQAIEDLETPIQQHTREDTSAMFHGYHPVWKYLTADRDLVYGSMIGEVRGTIGRLADYKADPSNKWDELRHPDHFVFFHPALPIFIDCRREGTLLRYARRSCRPNMMMETIITGEREYRFCFTAIAEIPRGAEITIGWDLRSHPKLRECLESQYSTRKISPEEKAYLHESIENILAHFGNCACEEQPEPCLMGHFDLRLAHLMSDSVSSSAKPTKKRKSLKRSPPDIFVDDHSRAGSEQMPQDDDMDDTRSTSRSTRSKPSREQTPTSASLRDTTAAKVTELSERDRKKLLQEEMLFNKLDQEKHQGPRKKKRNSGSNVNTPSAAISVSNRVPICKLMANLVMLQKHVGRRNSLTSTVNTPAPTAKARGGETQNSYFNPGHSPMDTSPQPQSPRASPHGRKPEAIVPKAAQKPTYASGCTQTVLPDDMQGEVAKPILFRKPVMSFSHLLSTHSRLRLVENASPEDVPPLQERSEQLDPAAPTGRQAKQTTSTPTLAAVTFSGEEIPPETETMDMDSPVLPTKAQSHSSERRIEARVPSPKPTQQPLQSSHPPINPPAPPWQAPMASMHSPQLSRTNIRSANLHVDLPPPHLQSVSSIDTSSAPTAAVLPGSIMQTPLNAGSLPVPAAVAPMSAPFLTQPTPMKKKMSLSDYTAKLKAKTPASEKSQMIAEPGSSSPAMARQQFITDMVDTPEGIQNPFAAGASTIDDVDSMQLDPKEI